MSNRVEYSWLTLLLVAAIGAFFFYQRPDGIQDNDQQRTVAPDDARQIVLNNSRSDRLPQASPSASANRVSPTSPTVVEMIDMEGAHGLNELGMRYLHGIGVERDLDAAFSFFSVAAQQGDTSAMNNLGWMYERGWGTASDRRRALELYAKATQLGNQLARDNLQRLTATISEAGRPIISTPQSTANAVRPNGGVAHLSPGEPNAISITERDTVRPRSDVAQAAAEQSSPDIGWPTGAIPLASSDTVQMSELKRRQTKANKFRRRSARDLPVDRAVSKSSRPEATSRRTRETKALVNSKRQTNKISERPRRTNRSRSSTAALRSLDPDEIFLREHCVTGNWVGGNWCYYEHGRDLSAPLWIREE